MNNIPFFSLDKKPATRFCKLTIAVIFLTFSANVYAQELKTKELSLPAARIDSGMEVFIKLPVQFENRNILWVGPETWLLNGRHTGKGVAVEDDNTIIVFPPISGNLKAYIKIGENLSLIATKNIEVRNTIQ